MATPGFPLRSAADTANVMVDLLRRFGDLAAYIQSIGDDDTITLRRLNGPSICITLPDPTTIGDPVDPARLDVALGALDVLTRAIAHSAEVKYAEPQFACLKRQTGKWVIDEEATQEALSRLAQVRPDGLIPFVLPAGLLEPLTPEQVKLEIAVLRRDLADVSSYIDAIDKSSEGDVVRILDFEVKPGAVPATLDGDLPHRDWFGMAEDAIRVMNSSITSGKFNWQSAD